MIQPFYGKAGKPAVTLTAGSENTNLPGLGQEILISLLALLDVVANPSVSWPWTPCSGEGWSPSAFEACSRQAERMQVATNLPQRRRAVACRISALPQALLLQSLSSLSPAALYQLCVPAQA